MVRLRNAWRSRLPGKHARVPASNISVIFRMSELQVVQAEAGHNVREPSGEMQVQKSVRKEKVQEYNQEPPVVLQVKIASF